MNDPKLHAVHNILAPGYQAVTDRKARHVRIFKESDPTKSVTIDFYATGTFPSAYDVYSASWELMRKNIRPSELLDLVVLRNERFETLKTDYEDLHMRFERLRGFMGHDKYREATEDPTHEQSETMSPSDWVDWGERKRKAQVHAAKKERDLLGQIRFRAYESDCQTAEAAHAWVETRYGKSRADAVYPRESWEELDRPNSLDLAEDNYESDKIRREVLQAAAKEIGVRTDWENDAPSKGAFLELMAAFTLGRYGPHVLELVFGDEDVKVDLPDPPQAREPDPQLPEGVTLKPVTDFFGSDFSKPVN